MSENIIQRRRALQRVLDQYDGWDFGIISYSRKLFGVAVAVSPYIAVPSNCTIIRYVLGCDLRPADLIYYNDSFGQIGYANINSGDLTRTPVSGTAYVRVCVDLDRIDNCYIYDKTNGQYLWKGKSVGGGNS